MKNKFRNGLIIGALMFMAMGVGAGVAAGVVGNTVEQASATTFTEVTTEINAFSSSQPSSTVANRQRLTLKFSVADWADIGTSADKTDAKVAEYNYLTKTLLNGVAVTPWSGWSNRVIFEAGGAKIPNLHFDIQATFADGDVITFQKGMQIPSYQYVAKGVGTNAYVLAADVSYKRSGSSWTLVVPFEEREVTPVMAKFTVGSAANHYAYLRITLSDYDCTANVVDDAWTKLTTEFDIERIQMNGSAIQLDAGRKNRFHAYTGNRFELFVTSEAGDGAEYETIMIPKGTEFPSVAYHADGTKVKYVVKEDVTLIRTGEIFGVATGIDAIKVPTVNAEKTRMRLAFNFTNFDRTTPYSGDGSVDTYKTDCTIFNYVTKDGSQLTRWTNMPDTRCYYIKGTNGYGWDFLNSDGNLPSTFVISKGLKVPSKTFMDGGVEGYYVVDAQYTFKRVSEQYADFACVNTVDAFVKNSLKMDDVPTTDVGTGKCISEGWYTDAKEAYAALGANEKVLFANDEAYDNARARLEAWAAANGEVMNGTSFEALAVGSAFAMMADSGNGAISYTLIIAVCTLSIVAVLFILKRRKNNK